MRTKQFLNALTGFNEGNYLKLEQLAAQQYINGGWEVWLQVEIARYMKQKVGPDFIFSREERYPAFPKEKAKPRPHIPPYPDYVDTRVQRSDFYVNSPRDDATYFELKCINPFVLNKEEDAWRRFLNDLNKIYDLSYPEDVQRYSGNRHLPTIALLATFQNNASIKAFRARIPIALDSFYILDTEARTVYTIETLGENARLRFLLIAATPTVTDEKRI